MSRGPTPRRALPDTRSPTTSESTISGTRMPARCSGVKGSDTLCPIGPGLVTDWEFKGKRISTSVNGEVRQQGSTDEMEWDMAYLVADLARTITLLPGDVILTGTPAGSRPVEPGDIVTVAVEGWGVDQKRSSKGRPGSTQPSGPNPAIPGGRWSRPHSVGIGAPRIRAPRGSGSAHYRSELDG